MARLVEELAYIRLRLSEPLCEQLGPLDADEVGLALVGDCLGEQRLAAAWRAVEEHAFGRVHAEELKLVRVLYRILHRLLELALDVLEAADVLPLDVGHLDRVLAQRRWVGELERPAKVLGRHLKRVEDLLGQSVGLEVHLGQLIAHTLHGRFEDHLRKVGATVALRVLREGLKVDLRAEPHLARLDAQDVEAAGRVGHWDVDLEVEATEAAERWLDGVRPVGGSHHDHLRLGADAVHEREHL